MLYVRVYYAPFTDSAPIRSPICNNIVYSHAAAARNRMNLNHSAASATEVPADRITVTYYKYIIMLYYATKPIILYSLSVLFLHWWRFFFFLSICI